MAGKKKKDVKVTQKSLAEYQLDNNNPNAGSERGHKVIVDSLKTVGPGRSIVVDKDGRIVAGNKTVQGILASNPDMEVVEVESEGDFLIVHKRADWELDSEEDDRARKYSFYDNRATEVGFVPDPEVFDKYLEEGLDFGDMYDPGELAQIVGRDIVDDILPAIDKEDPIDKRDPERAAKLINKWGVQRGKIWEITTEKGTHRVMCGDSSSMEDMRDLFDRKQAQIVVTSPPYAQQRSDQYGGIDPDNYSSWFETIQATTWHFLRDGGDFFINIKPHVEDGERSLYVFDLVVNMSRNWGWKFIDEFCWYNLGLPGRWHGRLKNGFEPIYHFQKPGERTRFYPERMGYPSEEAEIVGVPVSHWATGASNAGLTKQREPGMALPHNVIQCGKVRKGVVHSAMYPIRLPYFFIQIFADKGDIIFDPFAGSGTNIHAANASGCSAYCMELLEKHVAEILEEWDEDGEAEVLCLT